MSIYRTFTEEKRGQCYSFDLFYVHSSWSIVNDSRSRVPDVDGEIYEIELPRMETVV